MNIKEKYKTRAKSTITLSYRCAITSNTLVTMDFYFSQFLIAPINFPIVIYSNNFINSSKYFTLGLFLLLLFFNIPVTCRLYKVIIYNYVDQKYNLTNRMISHYLIHALISTIIICLSYNSFMIYLR